MQASLIFSWVSRTCTAKMYTRHTQLQYAAARADIESVLPQGAQQLLGQLPKEDVGSHTQDFGAYGEDPLKRGIGGAKDMTGAATTRDLAAGTARSTLQVPGMLVPHLDVHCSIRPIQLYRLQPWLTCHASCCSVWNVECKCQVCLYILLSYALGGVPVIYMSDACLSPCQPKSCKRTCFRLADQPRHASQSCRD